MYGELYERPYNKVLSSQAVTATVVFVQPEAREYTVRLCPATRLGIPRFYGTAAISTGLEQKTPVFPGSVAPKASKRVAASPRAHAHCLRSSPESIGGF